MLPDFLKASLYLAKLYWFVLGYIGLYWVILGYTRLDWVILGYIEFD